MNLVEKFYTLIIFLAVIIGISLGNVEHIRVSADSFILPLLIAMLYITFLQIPFAEVRKAFKNKKFTLIAVIINFIWTPALAWGLGMIFLGESLPLFIGFFMLIVTPCTDWYLIFTAIAKGNVALSTAILPLNLILQVILLPIYLFIFIGSTGAVEISFLLESIFIVLFLPLVLAWLTKFLLASKPKVRNNLISKLSVLPILLLSLAIVAMFATQGELLFDHLDVMWKITIPILLFFIVNFFVSQRIGRLLKFSSADRVSLSLTTLARNSPLALAIAMTAFPEQPLIPLTLVIGPLLELPILALITQVLLFLTKRRKQVMSMLSQSC